MLLVYNNPALAKGTQVFIVGLGALKNGEASDVDPERFRSITGSTLEEDAHISFVFDLDAEENK